MDSGNKHTERINRELITAGITRYGLLKREAVHLPKLIHKDEHIHGVVYGLTESGDSAMIVATDRRILYLDYKILFRKTDKLTYDVISGVSINDQGLFAGLVLHTRIGDFKLRFVNKLCARRFSSYIGGRQIETTQKATKNNRSISTIDYKDYKISKDNSIKPEIYKVANFTKDATTFLQNHDIATLSTVDEEGKPHGAIVYYVCDKNNYIYIATKNQTTKAKNIDHRAHVAVTIADLQLMQSMQLEGVARIEYDKEISKHTYEKVLRPRFLGGHAQLSPILHLSAGDYEVIMIEPTSYKLRDYKTVSDSL